MSGTILTPLTAATWDETFAAKTQENAINSLEQGQVLFFPQLAFKLTPQEQGFLSPRYLAKRSKNISFDPQTGVLRGVQCGPAERAQLYALMQRFSHYAYQLITHLFPPYIHTLQWARTSLRPVEIAGRITSYRKNDTLLHVDAFPATPNQGKRILRVFSNVNLEGKPRVWRLGAPFETVAEKFLPQVSYPFRGSRQLLSWLKITKGFRTLYDHIMLQIHNHMKADAHYQHTVPQTRVEFPSNSSWIVQTDQVSHAAMSGQHVLEQTFYLPVTAMVDSSHSPLRILEKMTRRVLV